MSHREIHSPSLAPTSQSPTHSAGLGQAPNSRPPTPDPRPLLAYFLLTILMTWPTILHLTGGIPGDGFDGWQNYWNLWWVKKALLELGTSPFFTDYLYSPQGASLLFHTLNIFNGLWTLPIQLNFGPAVAYNSVVLVSFVLAGYGGYLLSLYTLTQFKCFPSAGLRPAAFAGGLVFTMSPFHMAHLLGHMQVFSMIWPPFYVLWLLRILQPWASLPQTSPPASHLRGEGKNIAIACLFLVLATLVDWYHTLYLLIFTGLALVWTLWQRGGRGDDEARWRTDHRFLASAPHHIVASSRQRLTLLLRPFWLVLAIGLSFGIVLAPLLIPMIRVARNTPALQTGLEQSITLSADLLAFILPSEMHPLWGEWAKTVANNFSSTLSERLVFAGFVPLALALFIIIRGWQSSIVKFWTLVTGVFFILALGPYLHAGGKLVSLGNWPVPLPYLLLYHTVPFIRLTRSLSRYDLMVMLGLGVLTAISLAYVASGRWQVASGRWQVAG
ncbi:MAG TPA: hypothetical protein VEC93_02645, partial [Anaerolineae bacterium]|nr:hypothetical protein [Anaerolineae bacterium]